MSWVVVKVGGEVAADAAALSALAQDMRTMTAGGLRTAIVHGGGPQATELSRRLGIEPRIVGGRRITDRETLEVMKMVLGGTVNLNIVSALSAAGLRPVGLAGPSGGLILATRRPPVVVTGAGTEPIDLGLVGDVREVRTAILDLLAAAGYLPVVAPLGGGEQGEVYNINADIVALAVAAALGAEHLFHLTSVPGVLRDPRDPASRIPRLSAREARSAISTGAIRGGMIPKIEESLRVLGAGVGAIHIVGAGQPGALVAETRHPGSVGTVLVSD